MKFVFSFIAFTILFLAPSSAFAATKSALTIEPATIDVTLPEASSEAKITLSLTNTSSEPVSLEIFAVDFKQQDEFGRIAFLTEDMSGSYAYSLSSFLDFETTTMDLNPGEKKSVTATALNRVDLSPGGHYAAVVARLIQSGDETTVSPAVSSLILLRKEGGERFNLSLKDVQWPKNSFIATYQENVRLLFQNEGNIHLVPYGRVEIEDMFGRLIYKGTINSPSSKVFPQSKRYVLADLIKLEQSWPISFNTMTIDGTDSLKKTPFVYRTSFLYINPFLSLVILVPLGVKAWKRQKRRRAGE